MTLHLIGIGLADEKDITVRGLEIIRSCDKIYLEHYTSLLQCTTEELEQFYGKPVKIANRTDIENNMQHILDEAKKQEIAVLIIGDPLAATTHVNYLIEAKKQHIKMNIIHNASILTAVGEVGLELYKYGKVTSIPFAESETPYNVLAENQKQHLHTLMLLDLNPKENNFLTIKEAIEKLEKIESAKKGNFLAADLIAVARLGSTDSIIKAGTIETLKTIDIGMPPYCIIIPGKMHFVEKEAVELWKQK
jgi:diphthine synthase